MTEWRLIRVEDETVLYRFLDPGYGSLHFPSLAPIKGEVVWQSRGDGEEWVDRIRGSYELKTIKMPVFVPDV